MKEYEKKKKKNDESVHQMQLSIKTINQSQLVVTTIQCIDEIEGRLHVKS